VQVDGEMIRQQDKAFTMVELLVVIAIIGIIAAMALPAINSMITGQQTSAARNLIRTALAQAQAHAAKTQKYAGIRFEFDKDGWRKGRQYLVLIEKAPEGYSAYQYWAIPNARPIALPNGVGVISQDHAGDLALDDETGHHDPDWLNHGEYGLADATTFSIIFSPSGELVSKSVEVRYRQEGAVYDAVFGTIDLVNGVGLAPNQAPLLYHDNTNWPPQTDSQLWCYTEMSTTGLYLYETDAMGQAEVGARYTDYVRTLEPLLINMYTGNLINEDF